MLVIKRNKDIATFNKDKIVNAINAAMFEVDGQLYESDTSNSIADEIYKELLLRNKDTTVEEIQDMVEDKLMLSERKDVARAYIRFRYKKEVARNNSNEFVKAFESKIMATDVENSNANMDEKSFGGRSGSASSYANRQYALNYLLSKMARNNHLNNEIYIHDLDHYCLGDHNCLSVPIDDLLANGFKVRQVDIRPAGSVSTALQLVAVIFQVQSLCQFGGVSATHLDWSMVPYVRKSFYKHYKDGIKYFCDYEDWNLNDLIEDSDEEFKSIQDIPINNYGYYINYPDDAGDFDKVYNYAMNMTKKEIYQACEALFHNLNSLQSRSGSQLPFSSINFGTCTLPEGRMIIEALLNVSIDGLGKFHKTPIFPCSIFQCMKGVNRAPGDPNYDLFRLALRSTAQRLYPNYANVDWSGNAGYDRNDPRTYFSTMGCRTANGWDINGFGQLKDGRGNICPVTIILPTLAMEAKEQFPKPKEYNRKYGLVEEQIIDLNKLVIDKFFKILDKKIYEAKDMLIERFNYICSQSPESAQFMYENGAMAGYIPEEGIKSALIHGTLAVGQIGLAEALQILIGKDHTTDEGMELAKKIEGLFKKRCTEFKEEYKLNFGVYYSPAEGLCHTALKNFRKKYGIIPDVSDKEFFTNSMHIPVWKEMSPFDKIDIESQLTGYSSAGCITYVELDSSVKNNLDALEILVNYAMDKDIPYFAINVPVDECNDCGYMDDMNDECIMCGGHHVTHLRRVTGYLSGDYESAFNAGKRDEVRHRVKHRGLMR